MQPIENSAKLPQNPSKSVKFHSKIRTRLELSNFGEWRAASPTAFIRIFGHKTGLQPVLIHPIANLGDRTKMNVLSLNNHPYFKIHIDVNIAYKRMKEFVETPALLELEEDLEIDVIAFLFCIMT